MHCGILVNYSTINAKGVNPVQNSVCYVVHLLRWRDN